jgi:serine/threonine protein kinase
MGKFGAVFQARYVKDNLMYAVKRIQVREHIGEEQERIKREIDFLAGANCPHIVRYYRAWNECTDFDCQVSSLSLFLSFIFAEVFFYSNFVFRSKRMMI